MLMLRIAGHEAAIFSVTVLKKRRKVCRKKRYPIVRSASLQSSILTNSGLRGIFLL